MNSSIGRVKGRPYGHPLLIKPSVRISRKRLSFGIVPLQEMEPFNSSTGLDHSQPCQRRLCQHSLFCSGFQCDWEYRPSPSPPLVCLCSGLRLPILGNSAQYFAVPHCTFSSIGNRPGRGDFSQQWDMIFLSPMSWWFVVLMLQGTPVNYPFFEKWSIHDWVHEEFYLILLWLVSKKERQKIIYIYNKLLHK